MPIIELEKSLTKLHKELARLSPAIELAEKAVETTNLARAIPERHQQLINQLRAIFISPEDADNPEFVNVYSSIINLINELNRIKEDFIELEKSISNFIDYLRNNDIPNKLEAINFQLMGINNSLLAVQGQLNGIQNSINNVGNTVDNIWQNTVQIIADVGTSKESLVEGIKSFENATLSKFLEVEKRQDKQDKEIKLLKIIAISIAIISIVGTIVTNVTILVLKKPGIIDKINAVFF